MPTINVKPDSVLELQAIADVMGKSKKVVVVTGAGISTNCGIPDFRSENGLYSLIQAQYDAAAKDPSAYTEEIDFRPTKRRRVTDRWTYVTVAKETGEVVTDPDLVLPTPTNSQLSRSNSTETSAPTSSISSDIEASDNSSFTSKRLRRSLRSQPSNTNESSAITSSNPPTKPPAISSSNAGSNNRSIDRVFSAEPAPEPNHRSISRTFSVEPTPESSHHSINRTSSAEPAPEAHNKTPSFKGTSELQRQRVTRSTSVLSEPVVEPESKGESFSRSVSLRNQKELLQVSKLQQEVTTTDPIHSSDTTHPSTVLLKKFSTKFALEKSLGNPRRSTASNPEPAPTFTPSDSSSDQQKPRCPLLEASTSSISVDSIAIETQPCIKASLQRQSSSVLTTTEESCSQSFSSSQSSSRASLPNLKGKDLFDSMIWSDAFTTSVFYRFISTLRQKVKEDVRRTTESHRFIKVLRDGGRLVRCYTQNIDSLEEREGLRTELDLGPGDRSRFSTKAKKELIQSSGDGLASGRRSLRGGVEVVQLHGSLVGLRCGICGSISSWDDEDRHETTSAGQAPECPSCESKNASRTGRGRRSLTVGRLRPDIVLYGEEHPNAHLISPLITHDLSLGPDVLLILGTSLRVHGLKVMVREFAKSVHNKGGKVVFVNNTKPSESVWGDVIDYWVEWDCDAWVSDLKERRGDIWSPLGAAKEQKTKRPSLTNEKGDPKKPSRPSATRDCRMNGVYLTFKVLESLAGILDGNGQASARYQIDCIGTKPAATSSSRPNNPKSRRHITASNQNTSRVRKQSSTKKSRSTAVANYTTEKSSLGPSNLSPEATRQALAALSANSNRPLPATYGEFWRYGLSSNVLPGLTWPTQSINLLTHPPNTTGSPQHRSLAFNSTRDDNKMEELGRQSKDSARLDMQRVKSLKELGLRLETGHGLRIRSGLRSRRASVELPPVSIQVEAQPSPPFLANAEGTPSHDHSVIVKVTKACVECKRRKVRCNPAHHQTDPESSLPPLNHSTIDSNDMTQLSELPSSSSTSSDLQESVDAQLLREASALTSSTSSSACTDCMEQKKRCPPSHRPSLPTPPCSFSTEPKSRTKLPTPPISSDPATGTLTPTARRIKDMGNIGAVLSSPLKPTTRSSERLARRGSCS